MIEIICFLFPGVASAFFAQGLMNRTKSTRSLCFLMVMNTMLTNIAVMAVKIYVMASPELKFSSVYGIDSDLVVKYLLLSIVIGFLLGVVEAIFDRLFCLQLVDKKQKEEGKEE